MQEIAILVEPGYHFWGVCPRNEVLHVRIPRVGKRKAATRLAATAQPKLQWPPMSYAAAAANSKATTTSTSSTILPQTALPAALSTQKFATQSLCGGAHSGDTVPNSPAAAFWRHAPRSVRAMRSATTSVAEIAPRWQSRSRSPPHTATGNTAPRNEVSLSPAPKADSYAAVLCGNASKLTAMPAKADHDSGAATKQHLTKEAPFAHASGSIIDLTADEFCMPAAASTHVQPQKRQGVPLVDLTCDTTEDEGLCEDGNGSFLGDSPSWASNVSSSEGEWELLSDDYTQDDTVQTSNNHAAFVAIVNVITFCTAFV